MPQPKVITAPLAIIKVAGAAVGGMKNIRVTETFRRGRVTGIGTLAASELPVLEWTGSLSCSAYNIDLRIPSLPGALNRTVQDIEQFTSWLVLQEVGLTVDLLRRVKIGVLANGAPEYELRSFATVGELFTNRESFDIAEGQISGRDMDFDYTTPMLFPV